MTPHSQRTHLTPCCSCCSPSSFTFLTRTRRSPNHNPSRRPSQKPEFASSQVSTLSSTAFFGFASALAAVVVVVAALYSFYCELATLLHSSTPRTPPRLSASFLSTTQSLNSPGSGSGFDIKPFWRLRPNRLPCQSPIPLLPLLYNLLDEGLLIPRASSFTSSLLQKAPLHPVLDSDTTHSQCRRPQRTQRLPPPFPMARRTMCPFEATLLPRLRLQRPRCTLPTRP